MPVIAALVVSAICFTIIVAGSGYDSGHDERTQ